MMFRLRRHQGPRVPLGSHAVRSNRKWGLDFARMFWGGSLPFIGPHISCVGRWHGLTKDLSPASLSAAAREAYTTCEIDRIKYVKPVCGERIVFFVSVRTTSLWQMVRSAIEPVGTKKIILKPRRQELRRFVSRHIGAHLTFYVIVIGTLRRHRYLKNHACATCSAQVEFLKGLDEEVFDLV